jgi:hypothetical protein
VEWGEEVVGSDHATRDLIIGEISPVNAAPLLYVADGWGPSVPVDLGFLFILFKNVYWTLENHINS